MIKVRHHILVPIDFSNDSIHALEYAIDIANRLNFDIRLIHVKRKNADYNASFNLQDFDEVLKAGIIDNFEKLLEKYKDKLNGYFDYRIREGRIFNEICNQGKYGDSEFIIMGTHGVSGFEERWMGSNAFRVVSHADRPVISTRYDFPMRPIKHIILPIDKTADTRLKVPIVAKLALTFNAKVSVVDVRDNNRIATRKRLDEYMAQVMLYLERKKINCGRSSLKGYNISDTLIEYALINDADLIAIMNDRTEKAKTILIGQVAQQMVNHSPIPVLSFNGSA